MGHAGHHRAGDPHPSSDRARTTTATATSPPRAAGPLTQQRAGRAGGFSQTRWLRLPEPVAFVLAATKAAGRVGALALSTREAR